jgi:hypothetical protein
VAAILIFVIIVFYGMQVKEDFRSRISFGRKRGVPSRWIKLIALVIILITVFIHSK